MICPLLDWNEMPEISSLKKNLPMWITYSRIVITVPILFAMLQDSLEWQLFCVVGFILASISDYYDGYFARKWNSVSNMGKFMDPVADKILVTSVLTILTYQQKIDPWMAILIFGRDNYISGLRSVAASDQMVIAAGQSGKLKTTVQMIGIPMMILGNQLYTILGDWLRLQSPALDYLRLTVNIEKIGYWMLWFGVILSIWSGFQYYWAFHKASKK